MSDNTEFLIREVAATRATQVEILKHLDRQDAHFTDLDVKVDRLLAYHNQQRGAAKVLYLVAMGVGAVSGFLGGIFHHVWFK